jgi:hypothetical protein
VGSPALRKEPGSFYVMVLQFGGGPANLGRRSRVEGEVICNLYHQKRTAMPPKSERGGEKPNTRGTRNQTGEKNQKASETTQRRQVQGGGGGSNGGGGGKKKGGKDEQ